MYISKISTYVRKRLPASFPERKGMAMLCDVCKFHRFETRRVPSFLRSSDNGVYIIYVELQAVNIFAS